MKIYDAWAELQDWLDALVDTCEYVTPEKVLDKMDELEMKHE
jgi:hypothetical protein